MSGFPESPLCGSSVTFCHASFGPRCQLERAIHLGGHIIAPAALLHPSAPSPPPPPPPSLLAKTHTRTHSRSCLSRLPTPIIDARLARACPSSCVRRGGGREGGGYDVMLRLSVGDYDRDERICGGAGGPRGRSAPKQRRFLLTSDWRVCVRTARRRRRRRAEKQTLTLAEATSARARN